MRDPFTFLRDGIEMELTFRKTASLTETRLGKVRAKFWPLEATLREFVMVLTVVVKLLRRWLLLRSNDPMVVKLRPGISCRKVSVTVMLFAVVIPFVKVRVERALSAVHLMLPTVVKLGNEIVFRPVKLKRLNVPMLPIDELKITFKLGALLPIKLPPIPAGPLRSIVPTAAGPIKTLPSMVSQPAYCVASAAELIVMVAVETEHREVWAVATLRTANAGRRSFWENMVMRIMLL